MMTNLKKLIATLGFRIFLVLFLFLIVPLFIHNVVTYLHEYRQELKEVTKSVAILGKREAIGIENKIDSQINFLKIINSNVDLENFANDIELRKKADSFFQKIKEVNNNSEIFYTTAKANRYITIFSTDKKNVGKIYHFPKEIKTGPFAFYDFKIDKDTIFISLPIYSDQVLQGYLISNLPKEMFLKDLKEDSLPIYSSLIGDDGFVFISTDKYLLTKKILPSYEEERIFENKIEKGILSKADGDFIVLKIKILETNFSLLLDLPKSHIAELQKNSLYLSLFLFSLFFVIAGSFALLLIYFLSRPLKSLFLAMRKVSSGDSSAKFEKQTLGFELNILGQQFNQMLKDLKEYKQRELNEKIEKEKLIQQLRLAHEIQQSILPPPSQTVFNLELEAKCLPAKDVGGDFYDIYKIDEDNLLLTLGDVSGKGIFACLYSLSIKSIIRALSSEEKDLKTIIEKANHLFSLDAKDSGTFVTLFVAIYNKKEKTLKYTSLGHLPSFLKRKDEVLMLQTEGIALGLKKDISLKVKTVELQEKDVLLFYSDGVSEASNLQGIFWKIKGVEDFIKTQNYPLKEISENLLKSVKNFTQKRDLDDDLTYLLIEVK